METQGDLAFENGEIVVGLVCAVGVNYVQCIHVLDSEFKRMGYTTKIVSLSSLMDNLARSYQLAPVETTQPELARIRTRMKMGNDLRQLTNEPAVMALAAIQSINLYRKSISEEGLQPVHGTVHILSTLKRPEEVETLRRVYGAGFFLLGLHDTEAGRLNYLVDQQGIDKSDAEKLMMDDQDDHQSSGQLTRDTYYLSDVFVSLEEKKYKQQVERFVELLFSHPYHTPTRDEYSMFMAYATSLRSSQLGRQVGASILSEIGDIVGLGCNDVPKPHGGQYWCEDAEDDKRDHKLGFDSNDRKKQEIILDTLKRLGIAAMDPAVVKQKLKGSLLSDITEFGRAMHAEMDAILSCARNGITVLGTTLYTTTFPCHNCARHLLGAGVKRVVYIEPYAKSAALDLHVDGITIDTVSNEKNKKSTEKSAKIPFESFVGIGPRRYSDLFPMNPNYGRSVERKRDGKTIKWPDMGKRLRLPMHPISYLQREQLSVAELDEIIAEGRRRDGDQAAKYPVRGISKAPSRKRSGGPRLA
jgi:deoxycytidylate deaminase